jgi:hypothetical protein
VKEVKFTSEVAASRATRVSHGRYGLSPREAYVLRSAPIRGIGQAVAVRRHGAAAQGRDGLLVRGFLARRCGVGPAYANLTAEGRVAIKTTTYDL